LGPILLITFINGNYTNITGWGFVPGGAGSASLCPNSRGSYHLANTWPIFMCFCSLIRLFLKLYNHEAVAVSDVVRCESSSSSISASLIVSNQTAADSPLTI